MEAPTPWELMRNYDALRADLRTGLEGINTRLDKVPTADTLGALIARLDDRVTAARTKVDELEADLKAERAARAADRRMVVGAVLAAVGSLVVLIVSTVIGGVPS